MKNVPNITAAIILASCLASSPAFAALATADAGGTASTPGAAIETVGSVLSGPAGQGDKVDPFLDSLVATVVPPLSDSSSSQTKSVSPMSAYFSKVGPDPSMPRASGVAPELFSSPAGTDAATIPGLSALATSGAHYIGSGPVVSAAGPVADAQSAYAGSYLSSAITPSAQNNGLTLYLTVDTTPTPLPPAFFLMGSGLLGIYRLRKSPRIAA